MSQNSIKIEEANVQSSFQDKAFGKAKQLSCKGAYKKHAERCNVLYLFCCLVLNSTQAHQFPLLTMDPCPSPPPIPSHQTGASHSRCSHQKPEDPALLASLQAIEEEAHQNGAARQTDILAAATQCAYKPYVAQYQAW